MDLLHTAYVPPGDGPHPTVLALHGWGASALDLLGLAPHLGRGHHLVLCPQGGIEVPLGGASGWGWFPLTGGGPRRPSSRPCSSYGRSSMRRNEPTPSTYSAPSSPGSARAA